MGSILKVENINFDMVMNVPMKYGSEADFQNALMESRWLKERRGNITDKDLEDISSKYNFPPEFIKAGLDGLKPPADYLIHLSQWYPILYNWYIRQKNVSYRVDRAVVYEGKARHDFMIYSAYLIAIAIAIYYFYGLSFFLPSLGLLSGVILYLFRRYDDCKNRREELERYAKEQGYPDIAKQLKEISKEDPIRTFYSVMKSDEQHLSGVVIGEEDGVPVIISENPELEYEKRIRELMSKKE